MTPGPWAVGRDSVYPGAPVPCVSCRLISTQWATVGQTDSPIKTSWILSCSARHSFPCCLAPEPRPLCSLLVRNTAILRPPQRLCTCHALCLQVSTGSLPPFLHCSNVSSSQRPAQTILYKIEHTQTHAHTLLPSLFPSSSSISSLPPSRPNTAVSALVITFTVPLQRQRHGTGFLLFQSPRRSTGVLYMLTGHGENE